MAYLMHLAIKRHAIDIPGC